MKNMTDLTKHIVKLVKDNFIKFDDQQKVLQIVREALLEYKKDSLAEKENKVLGVES